MKKFEYKFSLSIDINIDSKEVPHLIDWFRKYPNILSAYPVVGKYDVHVVALTKSLEDIHQIKQSVK
jgi:DNA-binding Lrp family transcriptional regulator